MTEEEKQRELQTKIRLEDERSRKASPNYYGGMLTGPNPIPPVVTHSTPWKALNPKEPDEYDEMKEVSSRDGTFDDIDEVDDNTVIEILEELGETRTKKASGGLAYMLGE